MPLGVGLSGQTEYDELSNIVSPYLSHLHLFIHSLKNTKHLLSVLSAGIIIANSRDQNLYSCSWYCGGRQTVKKDIKY